eukprot:XP_011668258.1 PREDICTED: sodium/glucose cotransporter 4-like [Strongylocentrotus purpuratus]
MGNLVANGKIEIWDIIIIVVNFLGVFACGIWASFGRGKDSTSGYFLAGRQMPWYLVGLSLWMTNIGSRSFIGLAGSASVGGYGVAIYEFQALNCLLLLGFFFIPVYFASGVSTVPEYLKLRFGSNRLQISIAVINLITAAVIMLAIVLLATVEVLLNVSLLSLLLTNKTSAAGRRRIIMNDGSGWRRCRDGLESSLLPYTTAVHEQGTMIDV